jgi:Ran GTPase-activating protein (RanGAP) involved in mRNA processing and transport
MENKFNWKEVKVYLNGVELTGITPIQFVKPKYIQEIQYSIKNPFLPQFTIYIRELNLN